MRANEEYDYFFEVDGERRYDFDCDYNGVEIVEAKLATQANAATFGMPISTPQKMILTPG